MSRAADIIDLHGDGARIAALRGFGDVVGTLGGDPGALLCMIGADPALLADKNAILPMRRFVELLERAARHLRCADFGLRLAQRQHLTGVFGPLDVAMRNAATIGEAFAYCAHYTQTYSPAAQVRLERDATRGARLQLEILIRGLKGRRQLVEHALMLHHLTARLISGGRASGREIWFMHEPALDEAVYRAQFGVPVRFGRPCDAILFGASDLAQPVPGRDAGLHEMALEFVATRFALPRPRITMDVRVAIRRLLAQGSCSHVEVADALGLHPRTLQRRLREEQKCFETLKDQERREAAARYLADTKLPLNRVAERLGYSENAVLTRSCRRWFNEAPAKIRKANQGR